MERIRGAQIGHQIASGKDHADLCAGQHLAVMFDNLRACGQAFGGEGNIGRHHHIAGRAGIGDPFVCLVGPCGYIDAAHKWVWRWAHPAIGNQQHFNAKAGGDTFSLDFNGAGVCIDQEAGFRGVQTLAPNSV